LATLQKKFKKIKMVTSKKIYVLKKKCFNFELLQKVQLIHVQIRFPKREIVKSFFQKKKKSFKVIQT